MLHCYSKHYAKLRSWILHPTLCRIHAFPDLLQEIKASKLIVDVENICWFFYFQQTLKKTTMYKVK